jgi:hypothetical protein
MMTLALDSDLLLLLCGGNLLQVDVTAMVPTVVVGLLSAWQLVLTMCTAK